jgi:hypothetical protein
MKQENISTAECSWTNPLNALQEVIYYAFIKFCFYCFIHYEFFVHYALRAEKNYHHGRDVGPLEFQFLQQRGFLTNPFRNLSLCFRVIGTTFSFPNPLSESEELQSWGCSKILLSFLLQFNDHF